YPSVYRVIKINENSDATVETLLKSTENSVEYIIGTKEEEFDVDAATKGPFAVTVLSTMVNTAKDAESKILVASGDTFFSASDPFYGSAVGVMDNSSYANASFTVGVFNSLADNDSKQISIEPKIINELSFAEKISQTPIYTTIVNIIFMAVVPVALAVFAVMVFVIRKRK
ncbi:MAG: hypothetical protein IKT35_04990, partial [Clostridia bacterium]|nr:hypothetical protein [Clostridia bacterium]